MKIPFPAYVVVRGLDGHVEHAGLLPEAIPVVTVGISVKGQKINSLAWFTDISAASSILEEAELSGKVVPMRDAREAFEFLSKRKFLTVSINPSRMSEKPVTFGFAEFSKGIQDMFESSEE